MHNKAFWQEIIDDQYQLPEGADLIALTNELLGYLGSSSPELRENYSYNILSRWIAVHRYHDIQQLKSIGRWLTTRLEQGIGDIGTDSVFLRSYSASVLSLIAYRDVREQFLDKQALNSLLDSAQYYLLAERDLRARDPRKGWINAVVNTSSLLRYLAMNPKVSGRQLLEILNTLLEKITQPLSQTYNHDEEDRLARVALSIMLRTEVMRDDYHAWFSAFRAWHNKHHASEPYNEIDNCTYQNINRFLRSLYLQTLSNKTQLSAPAREAQDNLLLTVQTFSVV